MSGRIKREGFGNYKNYPQRMSYNDVLNYFNYIQSYM